MLINPSKRDKFFQRNRFGHFIAKNQDKISRMAAILLGAAFFALLGKVICIVGLMTLGDGFREIFEPLMFIGLMTGIVVGLEINLNEFYKNAIRVLYHTAVVMVTISLGIVLGWTIMTVFV